MEVINHCGFKYVLREERKQFVFCHYWHMCHQINTVLI